MSSDIPITVKEAVEADIPFIIESQIKMAFETEGMTLSRDTVTKGVTALFRDPTKGKYWVAAREQAIACVLTIPEWSDWRNRTVLWIHSLYVHPEFRKQGVFTEIYQFLKMKVEKSEDWFGLRLYVDKRNTLAQKAYIQAGMTNEHYEMFEWMK